MPSTAPDHAAAPVAAPPEAAAPEPLDGPAPAAGLRVARETFRGHELLSYPDRHRTVVDVLHHAVASHPDTEAFVDRDGERRVDYGTFARLVEGAVNRLGAEGMRPGDRLAVALPNSLDLAVALFACARGGFVMVGLNVRLQAAQWAYQLEHSGPSLALASADLLPRLEEAAAGAGIAEDRVREAGDHLVGEPAPWDYDPELERPDEAATFAVVYTSGTTGRPKASRVVHRASVHSGTGYARLLHLRAGDRTAVLFPLSYISGLHAHVLPMMLVGGTSVLLAEADGPSYVRVLRDERITWAYLVPSFWLVLLRTEGFAWPALAHLEVGAFGGSPFPQAMLDQLRQRMPQLRLHDVYGLSETHSPACILFDEEFRTHAGTVGRPLPCMEARIVDEAGRPVRGPGEPGELWLRGSLVTTGYEGDEEATAAAITTDGWFRTGDLARIDADGYVQILDRLKDMITRGGFKIFSVEVEQLLLAHPDIVDAAVVGVPDRVAYEAVAAYVVPRRGAVLDVATVRRWVGDRMADYAVPRQVRVVDAVPRNRTGKIEKAALREQLLEELPRLREIAQERATRLQPPAEREGIDGPGHRSAR